MERRFNRVASHRFTDFFIHQAFYFLPHPLVDWTVVMNEMPKLFNLKIGSVER